MLFFCLSYLSVSNKSDLLVVLVEEDLDWVSKVLNSMISFALKCSILKMIPDIEWLSESVLYPFWIFDFLVVLFLNRRKTFYFRLPNEDENFLLDKFKLSKHRLPGKTRSLLNDSAL